MAFGSLSLASLQPLQVREFRRWGAWWFQAGISCISPCVGRRRVNHRRSRTHLTTTGPGIGRFFVPTRSDSRRIDGCKTKSKGPEEPAGLALHDGNGPASQSRRHSPVRPMLRPCGHCIKRRPASGNQAHNMPASSDEQGSPPNVDQSAVPGQSALQRGQTG
jgi:hypothetical protein